MKSTYSKIFLTQLIALIASLTLIACGAEESTDPHMHDSHDSQVHEEHAGHEHSSEEHGTTEEMKVPEDARKVTVTATDYAFEPATIKATPGEKLFIQLVNESHSAHMWQIKEKPNTHIHAMSEQSASKVITGPEESGDYSFFCGIKNHEELGMVGTLRIENDQ